MSRNAFIQAQAQQSLNCCAFIIIMSDQRISRHALRQYRSSAQGNKFREAALHGGDVVDIDHVVAVKVRDTEVLGVAFVDDRGAVRLGEFGEMALQLGGVVDVKDHVAVDVADGSLGYRLGDRLGDRLGHGRFLLIEDRYGARRDRAGECAVRYGEGAAVHVVDIGAVGQGGCDADIAVGVRDADDDRALVASLDHGDLAALDDVDKILFLADHSVAELIDRGYLGAVVVAVAVDADGIVTPFVLEIRGAAEVGIRVIGGAALGTREEERRGVALSGDNRPALPDLLVVELIP